MVTKNDLSIRSDISMGRSRSVSVEVRAIAQHTCSNGKNVVAVPRNHAPTLPDTRAAVL